jgi:hypothetical protein
MKHFLAMLPTLVFVVSKKGNQKWGKGYREKRKQIKKIKIHMENQRNLREKMHEE